MKYILDMVDSQSALCKAGITQSELHMTRVLRICSEAENSTIVAIVKRLGLMLR